MALNHSKFSDFSTYLEGIPEGHRVSLERIIEIVHKHAPEAEEGVSYGLPAFRYRGRPLIGFSSNKHGLNIYPFDPRIVSTVSPELEGFEVGKGVIRFSVENPLPEDVIVLLVSMRLDYLRSAQ